MALRVRRLGAASSIAAATRTRLYTVPAGKAAILRAVHFSNDNAGDVNMGITLNGNGFVWDNIVKTFGSLAVPLGSVVKAGDVIDVEHSATSAYTLLQGVEFDVPPPTLHRVDLTALTTTAKTYTVPTAKRFRIRELVICPHSSSGNVNVFINSIGHIAKVAAQANKNVVAGLDLSVNAGEQIGATASAGTIHAFLSGVLEDA